jgi:hypothetical protein
MIPFDVRINKQLPQWIHARIHTVVAAAECFVIEGVALARGQRWGLSLSGARSDLSAIYDVLCKPQRDDKSSARCLASYQ